MQGCAVFLELHFCFDLTLIKGLPISPLSQAYIFQHQKEKERHSAVLFSFHTGLFYL